MWKGMQITDKNEDVREEMGGGEGGGGVCVKFHMKMT